MILLHGLAYCLVLSIFIRWLWSRRNWYILSWQMPGPFSFPFIGSAISLALNEKLDYLDYISKKFGKYHQPIRLWLGTRFFIFVDNAEDIQTILCEPATLNRDKSYQFIREAIGVNGMFTLEGNDWKRNRRLVSPSFNYNIVITYLPVFNKQIKILRQNIAKKVDGPTFDIRDLLVPLTLNSFLEASLGAHMNENDKKKFAEYMTHGQELVSKRIFSPWFHPSWIWHLTNYPYRLKEYRVFAHNLMDELLAGNLSNDTGELTFMERLIRISDNNHKFTIDDVKAETTNSFTAASDTSSWAMAFTILMLAMHPEHQEAVAKELLDLFQSQDLYVEREHIENMPILERCIKETLRLFPVVTLIARKCDIPFKLRDYNIEPGTSFAIGIQQLHRREEYWGPNAHLFNPDNFLPERVSARKPFCYIPFSDGPRNCIGWKYAMIVMKLVLGDVLRNYRFTTKLKLSELKVRMDINIFLLNRHLVQVHRRNFDKK